MDTEAIIAIVKCAAFIIGVIIEAYGVPLLCAKIGETRTRNLLNKAEVLWDAAQKAVRWAEQEFKEGQNDEKKSAVFEKIVSKYMELGLDINTEEIQTIQEAAVNYVKYGMEYKRGNNK